LLAGGTGEQADWFNEPQRISISPEEAVRAINATSDLDVSAPLSQVAAPTLVMHARDDARVPFDQGRRLAAGIPGARFVPLASRNHIIMQDEPAFPRSLQEIREFLAMGRYVSQLADLRFPSTKKGPPRSGGTALVRVGRLRGGLKAPQTCQVFVKPGQRSASG
jgi:pimeloyl-ACP methyl ester carboxylesterase